MATGVNTGRAVLLKSAADVVARASGLITFPVVAHYVGAAGYGAFTQVATVVGIVIPLASLGIGSGMVRFFATQPWSRGLADQILRVGFVVGGLSLFFTVVVALLAPLLNDAFLGYSDGVALFRWGAFLVFTGAVEFWVLDLLRARDWLMLYAGVQFSQTAALVVATVLLLTNGYGVVSLMIATVVFKAIAITFAICVVALRGRRAGHRTIEARPTYGRMLRFGLPLTIANLGLWMVNLSDRLVVGGKLGAAAVGRYGIVYNLASLMVMGVSGIYLPAYARLMRGTAQGEPRVVEADIAVFHRYIVIVLVPLAVWLAVIIKPSVRFLGGAQFHVGILVVLPIVIAIFLNQWNGLAHYVLIVNDRTPLTQNLWFGAGVLNVVLCLALIPLWGLTGAAMATLIAFVLIELVQFRVAGRYVDIVRAYRFASTGRAAAAGAAGAAVAIIILELVPAGGVALVAASVAFFAVYLLGAIALREIGREELNVVLRAVRPKAVA